MLLIIGSEALRHFGVKMPERKRLDIDIIITKDSLAEHIRSVNPKKMKHSEDASAVYVIGDDYLSDKTIMYEYEVAWSGSAGADLLDLVAANPGKYAQEWFINNEPVYFARPEVVLALKLSHRYKKNSPHFLKTLRDIQALRAAGFSVPKELKAWFKKREKETYNYKHPKLMGVKKGEFFSDDGISYVYDHDSIHEAVKTMDKPAYSRFQPDGEEIGTSKAMFFKCPLAVQLLAVLEEAYVLSLERAIIPFDMFGDAEKCRGAFDMALSKVCTSITSGWFREFSWENFDKVNQLYDPEYVTRFSEAVSRGEVKPHNAG